MVLAANGDLAQQVREWVSAIRPVLWPIVVLVLLVYLMRSGLMRKLAENLRGVSGAGFKFEFSATGAAETRASVENGLADIRRTLRREFDVRSRQKRIPQKRQRLVREVIAPLLVPVDGVPPSYRCTLHVPDPLLGDSLYQLLDYYPDGRGKGRSFSFRVGLMGAVWRSGESKNEHHTVDRAEVLVGRWGMTLEEADRSLATGRQSFFALLLQDDDGDPVAILYMDSTSAAAFGADDAARAAFLEAVRQHDLTKVLARSLAEAVTEMLEKSPAIDVRAGENG